MEDRELTAWVQTQVALLEPPADWEPSVAIARARVEGSRLTQSRIRRYAVVAAAAVVIFCAMILAIPATRALGQPVEFPFRYHLRLDSGWYWIAMLWNGPGIVVNNLEGVPDEVKALRAQALAKLGAAQMVHDGADASRRAGFEAHLPHALEFPQVSVLDPMSFNAFVSAAGLESALRKAGVRDFEAPANWDGSRIEVRLGGTVVAEWSGAGDWSSLTLAQTPLPAVSSSAGLDVEEFAAASFRVGHVSRERASLFTRLPTIAAALLIGREERNELPVVVARRVDLRSGPATLIEEMAFGWDTPMVVRLSLLWNTPDRIYALSGIPAAPPQLISADLARAWTNLARIANTIE
jgi:hypothetical protein